MASRAGTHPCADGDDGGEGTQAVGRLDRREGNLDRDVLAISPAAEQRAILRHRPRPRFAEELGHVSDVRRAIAFGHQDVDLLIQQGVAVVAEQSLRSAIDEQDAALAVHDHDGTRRRLDDMVEPCLGPARRVGGLRQIAGPLLDLPLQHGSQGFEFEATFIRQARGGHEGPGLRQHAQQRHGGGHRRQRRDDGDRHAAARERLPQPDEGREIGEGGGREEEGERPHGPEGREAGSRGADEVQQRPQHREARQGDQQLRAALQPQQHGICCRGDGHAERRLPCGAVGGRAEQGDRRPRRCAQAIQAPASATAVLSGAARRQVAALGNARLLHQSPGLPRGTAPNRRARAILRAVSSFPSPP